MAERGKDIEAYIKSDASDEVLSKVLQEHDHLFTQRRKRVDLLKKLAREDLGEKQKSGVLCFICSDEDQIDAADIPAIGDALLSIGDVDRLDLLIHGPGGDGTVAEKIIGMCRSYCSLFRVIVPNRAKSAATIIALGADEIVMGHCSELGPIDPQVPILAGGIPQYISAQSVIDARNELEKRFQECIAEGKDPRAALQQLAAIEPTFVDHCEKLMAFCRDVARQNLSAHMFKGIASNKRSGMITKVLNRLSSPAIYKVHGRMIDGRAARSELGLTIRQVPRNDEYWKSIWSYYVRADVALSRSPITKIIETRDEYLLKSVAYSSM